MADESVEVKVGGEASGATEALQEVAKGVKDLKDAVSKATEGAAEFKDMFLKAFTVEAIYSFVEGMTTAATTIERLTTALGTTNFQVAVLDVAAKSAGTSVSSISDMMSKLENNVARAAGGFERSKDALADLGLKVADFKGLDMAQKMDLLASKLATFKDGTEKTAAAQQLLGGAASYLMPILNRGAGAFEEYNAVVQRSSVTATPDFINEMSRLDLAIIEAKASMAGLGMTIVTAFGPALTGLANTVSQFVQGITRSVQQVGLFGQALNGAATVARVLVSVLAAAVGGAQTLAEIYTGVARTIAEAFLTLGRVIKAVFSLDFEGAKQAFSDFGVKVFDTARKSAFSIEQTYGRTAENIKGIWSKAAEEEEKVEQTKDINRKRRNADAIAGALLRYEGEIAAARDALKQKQALLDFEVTMGRINNNEKFALLAQYTNEEYQAEVRALNAELQIGGLRIQQRQQILNRLAQLERQHTTDMINLDRQSLQAQLALVKQYVDTVASAFSGQLRGLLTGQTSFSQAMKNILLDLSIKTIELIAIKPAAEFAAQQIAMVTASQTGAAARAAGEVAAAEAALPAKIAAFTSDLTARAALTFAGVFANLAPLLGPAAAGPAAASEAVVMAQIAAVPKFDIGSWSVPQTGLAVVHKGEFIAPAGAPSEAARNAVMGAGGGRGSSDTHNWNIQALDGPSFGRWLRNGGGAELAKFISEYQDKNPSARRKRGGG